MNRIVKMNKKSTQKRVCVTPGGGGIGFVWDIV